MRREKRTDREESEMAGGGGESSIKQYERMRREKIKKITGEGGKTERSIKERGRERGKEKES